MDFLENHFPEIYNLYTSYGATISPYILPIYRTVLLTQSYFYRYFFPTLYPIYTLSSGVLKSFIYSDSKNNGDGSSTNADLFSLVILALILLISIRVMDYMRKTIIYFIGLALKLALWTVVLGIGWYVYQRGFDQALEDIGWVWGLFEAYSAEGQKVGKSKARQKETEQWKHGHAGRATGRARNRGW